MRPSPQLLTPRRVLVTGATGFVASRAAARWVRDGATVRALVRRPTAIDGVETVVGDLLDAVSLERALRGVDAVVHAAVDESGDVDRMLAVNVSGTRALAEAASRAGCRRFVHVSTCGVYALEGVDVVTESSAVWPDERIGELPYGVTKARAEEALQATAASGLHVVVLRPPNVLGAHQRSVFCERLATLVRDGGIGYALDGGTTWPFVHVENLIDAIDLALHRDVPPGRAYTIVDGHMTWRAFLQVYADWFGVELRQREPRPPYDLFRGRFATDRARDELGYEPRLGFDDAMEETRRFLEAQGLLEARS